jgi:hypothetical protein
LAESKTGIKYSSPECTTILRLLLSDLFLFANSLVVVSSHQRASAYLTSLPRRFAPV